MALTKKQIEFRMSGLGGSDIGDLFSIEPYGCERKLFYIKRGTEPDFDAGWDTNPNVLRGNALEPIIKTEFEKKHNVKITIPPQKRSKEHPFLLATTDGEYTKEGIKKVWESKAPTTDNFKRHVRLGLPFAYILQMQTYLYVMDLKIGTWCLFSADMWKMMDFDVPRDDKLIAMIIEKGETFWRQVENGPIVERLEQGDKRCKGCIYRLECWQELWQEDDTPDGVESDYIEVGEKEEVAFVKAFEEYEEGKELEKQAKGIKADAREELVAIIGDGEDRKRLKCSKGKAVYQWEKKTYLDRVKLESKYPGAIKECSYSDGSLVLRTYGNKKGKNT